MNHQRFPEAKYANIFSYKHADNLKGYAELDEATLRLVEGIPGYVGHESVKDSQGRSIFISYWTSLEAIELWRKNTTHQKAKDLGKSWYTAYHSMLVKIESSSEHNTEIL